MANTRELVNRRKGIRNTRKITKTMEMVATARLQRAQTAAIASRPYAQTLREIIGDLAAAGRGVEHPLLRVHEPIRHSVVIILTSDRGLCGAFNANVLRKAYALLERLRTAGREIEIIAIGKKAITMLAYRGEKITARQTGISDKPRFESADKIATDLMERYAREAVDEAFVVYSEFRSVVNQVPRVDQFLPISAITAGEAESGADAGESDYIFHPNPQAILEQILPLVVKISLFNAMLQHAAGEHAARRLAMKNATDAADDMITMISRKYNRARQAKITTEITEIVGGAEAL